MNSQLVGQLRDRANNLRLVFEMTITPRIMEQAADEIERLREEVFQTSCEAFEAEEMAGGQHVE